MKSAVEFLDLDWDLTAIQRHCMKLMMIHRHIYPGQLPLLFTLKRIGPCNQKEFAQAMHLAPATITVSLRRMEKSGFIQRIQDPGDLRSNRICLTEQGLDAADWAEKSIYAVNSHKLDGFTSQEISQLAHFYRRMRQNLDTYRTELEGQEGNP